MDPENAGGRAPQYGAIENDQPQGKVNEVDAPKQKGGALGLGSLLHRFSSALCRGKF